MKKKDVEYSKRTLSAIVKLWFAGAIFGMCYLVVQLIIAPDMASLDGLLTYIGAPRVAAWWDISSSQQWKIVKKSNKNIAPITERKK